MFGKIQLFFPVLLLVQCCEGRILLNNVWDDIAELVIRRADEATRGFGEIIRTTPHSKIEDEYDFIVVGSGASGSVIATRLSEIGNWKVLLLEVGRPENLIGQIPLMAPLLQYTGYNYGYTMEPQDNFCLGMEARRCAWPRGKALGGSSAINYMIYTRGNRLDYDRWAAMGNPGWSYDEVLPYFIKSEDTYVNTSEPEYHGHGGYLGTSTPYHSELARTFLEAAKELGHNVLDYNAKEQLGMSFMQSTTKKGRRNSAARAFLKPVLERENLHVLTQALVTKINIDPLTKHIIGVFYQYKGRTYSVRARKEVILSAGAFRSPQLLMISGIGPQQHLEELGVPVIKDLPVGLNMADHIAYLGLTFTINKSVATLGDVLDPVKLLDWYNTGRGPMGSIGGIEAVGFVKTNVSTVVEDYPDIEFIFVGTGGLQSDNGLFNRKFMRITDRVYNKAFQPLEGIPSWTIFPMLLHPKSRGYMKLRSKDIKDEPLFHGNYFTHPDDKQTLIEGIKQIVELSKTKAFQRYDSKMSTIPIPGCEYLPFLSDSYWSCCLDTLTSTLHHQTSTCKMGPPNDPESVVNNELKVYGISGLRVADTSIFPGTVSGHTNAPAIMVGERVSDMIKSDWLNV